MVDPTNRPAHLNALSGSPPAAEVSILTGFSDAFGLDAAGVVDLPVGTDIGGVTLVRLLAEGGMGRVYEGRQRSPDRAVAVKILRGGLASPDVVRRFAQEARVLARLKHPHIAHIYMLGTFPHGAAAVPFFVLELVDGALPIDRFVRERRLSARQTVAVFRRVVAAVAHGHRAGVVHRDLKPGNILVGGDGEPKVIDFGVARCTGGDLALTTSHGDTGGIVGTLRYMSPEQFDGDSSQIDPRTDVYGLGLVLHELLTGDLPYDVRGKPLAVASRIVREQEPRVEPRMRRALAGTGDAAAGEAATLAAIVEKCLQKWPADRYESAAAVEADLGRWLAGEVVLARPLGRLGRCSRWLRRHRAATGIALTTMAIVAAVAVTASLHALRQRTLVERHRAAAARQLARADVEAAYAKLRQAAEALDRGNVGLARSLVDESVAARAAAPPPIELAVLSSLLDDEDAIDESLAVLKGHADRVTSVAAADAGRLVATGSEDGTARLWRADESGGWRETALLDGHAAGIWGVALSPDGTRLATAAADRTACLWNVHDGMRLATLRGHGGPVYGVAFAAAGDLVATASGDRTVRLWDVDGTPRAELTGHADTVFGVAFSPDSRRLASASRDRTVRLWDVASREHLATLEGHERRVFNACFSPDGTTLASSSEDGTVRLWHVESRGPAATLRHPLRVNAAAFDGDGSRLATATVDGVLRILDPRSGREVRRLRGHDDGIWSVASLTSGRFVSGSADGTARIWDADTSDEPLVRCGSGVQGVAVSPDGRLLATALTEGGVLLWDRVTLRRVVRLPTGPSRVNAIEFSPDGHRLAAACHDGVVRQFRSADWEPCAAGEATGRPVYAVAFSPDGKRLATAGDDGRVRVRDAETHAEVAGPLVHPRRALGVAWSRDGGRLATACADGLVRVWDAAGAGPPAVLAGHAAAVNWVTFSPDGTRLASCSSDGTARLWDPASGAVVRTLDGPVGQIWEVAFSPEGTRLAGVGADRRLHLWECEGGRHLVAFAGHTDEAWAVAFSPDGTAIFTGAWDGTARLWGCSVADLQRRRAVADR